VSAEHAIRQPRMDTTDLKNTQHAKQSTTQRVKLHIIEKALYVVMIVAIFALIILLLNAKNDANLIREQIHNVEHKSEELKAENDAIKADIERETSYRSIQQKTKDYGMKQNMSNVQHIRE
jgi:cell division protein FtsL